MTVEKISWATSGYDIHMIPGTAIHLLTIYFTDGPPKTVKELVSSDNVTVTFDWTLKHNLNVDNETGVKVEQNGILSVNNPLPTEAGKRVYNFIIEVTVNDHTNTNVFHSAVRVHVHDDIVEAWLTPSKLYIRQGSNGYRFSILATFIDNVKGEPHQTPGDISWASEYGGILWESSDNGKITVDPTGKLTANVSNATDVKIKARLNGFAFGVTISHTLEANVDVLPPWNTVSAEVRLVGRNQISEEEIKKYPNLLFVAEGYTNKSEFENDVNLIVDKIKESSSLMPFNFLSTRNKLNYWSLFLPSEGNLITPLFPIHDEGTEFQGLERYAASDFVSVKPDLTDLEHEWTLQELNYMVGLPLLSDFNAINFPNDYTDKSKEWGDLFVKLPLTLDILRNKKGKDTLWSTWRAFGIEQPANELVTALGIANGARPNVDLGRAQNKDNLGWHPFRMTRAHLDSLLENLKTSTETTPDFPIGERWGSKTGADRRYVIALCRRSAGLGTSSSPDSIGGEIICVSVGTIEYYGISVVMSNHQYQISATTSSTSHFEAASTLCHEFGHVLELGNESGGFDSMPSDFIIADGNLQAHADLIDSSGAISGISGKDIKWNWPRIMKAGILLEYLSIAPSELKIRLDNSYKPRNNTDYFNTSNNVRFRQRTLPSVETSLQEFHIDSIKNDTNGDILTLKTTNSAEFKESDFPIGSLLIVTRPEIIEFPDDRPFMRLIHNAVLNHINITKRPLTAPPPPSSGNVPHDCVKVLRDKTERPSTVETQYPRNIPLLRHPKSKNRCTIVGVYEGGNDYECNVYHPTGYCNFRGGDHSRFCHVCRYFIVDKLDPTLHRDIDRVYENNYPFR